MSEPVTLTFLGTGNFQARRRYWNSFVLDGTVLVEPSPTALPHLHRYGIPVSDIMNEGSMRELRSRVPDTHYVLTHIGVEVDHADLDNVTVPEDFARLTF